MLHVGEKKKKEQPSYHMFKAEIVAERGEDKFLSPGEAGP